MTKFLLSGSALLAVALYFVTSYALEQNAELAETKFAKIIVERNVSSLKEERAVWEGARLRLEAFHVKQKTKFNKLQEKYNEISEHSKSFLDSPVPSDIASVLRESDSALREHIYTTERPIDADAIAAAYQALTNRRVYQNREEYIQALESCNADKREIYLGFYGDEKKPGN